MDATSYIGIDIARNKFDAAIYREGKKPLHNVFDNTPAGFAALLKWAKQPAASLHITMEATNTYWEELAYFLYEAGCTVSVVNPKCIKHYGSGQNLRGKTDKIDAVLIARYSAKEQPQNWQPPRATERTLLLRLRQLEHLKSSEQKERTRISMLKERLAIESSKRLIQFLQQEIKSMEKQIAADIQADEALKRGAELLRSIPAVGEKTVAWLLAYLGDGSRFKNGKAAAAYAGLTPMPHQSGSSVSGKTPISKIGHSEIRKIMYMPALVYSYGIKRDGVYRAFVSRLQANGKQPKEVITALMRKVLTIAQAVLKSGVPFNADLHEKSFNNA